MNIGKLTVGNVWEDKPDAINIYIGRAGQGKEGSPLQNPYQITGSITRSQVITRFKEYLDLRVAHETPQKAELTKIGNYLLQGKNVNLQCFCHTKYSTKECHGEVIQKLVQDAVQKYLESKGQSNGN